MKSILIIFIIAAICLQDCSARVRASGRPRQFRSIATGFCLGTNSDNEVNLVACSLSNDQKWQIGNGEIRSIETNNCLTNAEGSIYAAECNDNENQLWVVKNGQVKSENQCLDIDTSNSIIVSDCVIGNDYQRWYVNANKK